MEPVDHAQNQHRANEAKRRVSPHGAKWSEQRRTQQATQHAEPGAKHRARRTGHDQHSLFCYRGEGGHIICSKYRGGARQDGGGTEEIGAASHAARHRVRATRHAAPRLPRQP